MSSQPRTSVEIVPTSCINEDPNHSPGIQGKAARLKGLIDSPQLAFLMEAHNGLSARIVQEAGFKGIWASGLAISAQLGVRDSNEASWTQVLEVLEFMADVASIPILVDGDTGYGNFNNVQRLVRKLEQRGIAGVCIEDKEFPKKNSFINGSLQALADVDEFCGKIKAAKDAQADDDFCVVARVEAFIAGWGLAEALRRAEAYERAGADAILIHSSLAVPDEVLAFKQEWGDRSPVIIVPTKYYAVPTELFADRGFSVVIWANQMVRASILAMQDTAKALLQSRTLLSVEDKIASIAEVFRLQGATALEEAEKQYLPKRVGKTRALILAASRGAELGSLTEDKPKTMIEVVGRPILAHIATALRASGINSITVVRGYKSEAVNEPGLNYVDNPEFDVAGELISLRVGLSTIDVDCEQLLIAYGDILFKKHLVELLLDDDADATIVVDTNWQESGNKYGIPDYVVCSVPYSRKIFGLDVELLRIGSMSDGDAQIHGEWVGLLKVSRKGIVALQEALDFVLDDPSQRHARVPTLLQEMIRRGLRVRVIYSTGQWLDVNAVNDVITAASF